MATAVDQALTEVTEFLATLAPDVLGATQYAEIQLSDSSKAADLDLLGRLQAIQQAATFVQSSLQALLALGYPAIPTEVVDQRTLDEVQARLDALTAARRLFTPRQPPVSGVVTPGTPQP
jgi:hypothetical protein